MAESEKNWEREVLEKLAFSALKEQRRARYWGIFFKLLTIAYVTFLILMVFEWRGNGDLISDGKHTPVAEVEGVIDAKSEASAEKINRALRSGFEEKNTQGVILSLNSPGGSPVQSGISNDEVRPLRGVY